MKQILNYDFKKIIYLQKYHGYLFRIPTFFKDFLLNYSKIKIFTILFTELFISFQFRF